MIRRRHTWTLLLLGAALAGAGFTLAPRGRAQEGPAAPQEVLWRKDYNSARKEAQEKNLPLLIDFGTKQCYWCTQLDMKTFRHPKVCGVMNEKFIPLKVDAEVEVALTSSLRIDRFPTIVLATPDGKILDTLVGFKEADPFHETLQRALGSVISPDWMQIEFQRAQKWFQEGEFPRAISACKTIVEDGKNRPVQLGAAKLLKDIEARANEQLARARDLKDKGKNTEAIELLTDTIRNYAGLQSSKDAAELLTRTAQAQTPDNQLQQRARRAAELLAQAREFQKSREYLPCMDRCEALIGEFGDLPEGRDAAALLADLKSNTDELQKAADTLSDRLGGLYLALADAHLKKGRPQQAEFYLQRVILAFPGTRQAESAQIRLGQLQGTPARRVEIQAAGP